MSGRPPSTRHAARPALAAMFRAIERARLSAAVRHPGPWSDSALAELLGRPVPASTGQLLALLRRSHRSVLAGLRAGDPAAGRRRRLLLVQAYVAVKRAAAGQPPVRQVPVQAPPPPVSAGDAPQEPAKD